jgi:hypothetical protein
VFAREDCRFVEVIGGSIHWTGFDFYLNGGTWAWWVDSVALVLDGDPVTNKWAAAPNPNPGMAVATFYSTAGFSRGVLVARCADSRTVAFPWQGADHGTTVGFTGDGGTGINFGTPIAASNVLTFAQANAAGTYTGAGALARILSGTGAGDERFVLSATPGATTVTLASAFAEFDATGRHGISPYDVVMAGNDQRCRPLIQTYG